MFETLSLRTDTRGIAHLTLNRPDKHNAMNAVMIGDLTRAARDLGADPAVRAVVLSANGPTFCAGGDLGWMRDQARLDRAGKIAGAYGLANMLLALNRLPKPLIAKVEGNAFGGGIGLMAVCDVVLARPNLSFALTETKLGLIPATIGPFVQRKLVQAYSRQVFFSAKPFKTGWAVQAGLVSQMTDTPDEALSRHIKAILTTAPNAVAAAKTLLLDMHADEDAKLIGHSVNALADCWESKETMARISAFLDK